MPYNLFIRNDRSFLRNLSKLLKKWRGVYIMSEKSIPTQVKLGISPAYIINSIITLAIMIGFKYVCPVVDRWHRLVLKSSVSLLVRSMAGWLLVTSFGLVLLVWCWWGWPTTRRSRIRLQVALVTILFSWCSFSSFLQISWTPLVSLNLLLNGLRRERSPMGSLGCCLSFWWLPGLSASSWYLQQQPASSEYRYNLWV